MGQRISSSVARPERKHEPKKADAKILREIGRKRRHKKCMASKPMFEVQADPAKNVVRVRYVGHVTAAGAEACCAQVGRLLPELRQGFTVVTDLSGLESMDLDCVASLTKIMDHCRAKGVGTVIRVIPDREKDIGFNILSIIHYRRGVKIVTCETLAEAERALKL